MNRTEDAPSSSPQKKRRRKRGRSESLDEPPLPVDIDTPEKLGEKKKKRKKKKKREEEEEEEISLPPPAEEQTEIKKKRKKVKNEEESISIVTADDNNNGSSTREKKKKKKKQEEEVFVIETTETEEKKKKKKKQKDRSMEQSVAVVTTDHNNGESVPMETDTSRTAADAEDGDEPLNNVLLTELEEFIPDVRKKCQDVVRKLLRNDLQRFRDFKQKGVSLRCGRFSKEENQQIRDNVKDFMALTGISSANQLLFPQRHKDKEVEIRKLRIQHHFLERIAEGIPRPCDQVHIRAKKLMDDRNHMGRFSKDEVRSLTKLQTLHGNDWKTIGDKIDRSIYAVQKRFATIGAGQGAWSSDEESRLKQAVKAHLEVRIRQSPPGSGLSREQLCINLPWKDISLKVESRTWLQCRLKWFSILKTRLSAGRTSTPQSAVRARMDLIHTLSNMNVNDAGDVDWMEVAHAVGSVTPVCVQKMFHRLKVTRVLNWPSLSYGEVLDVLQEVELPRLQKKLQKLKKIKQEKQEEMQDSYQLSDIFSNLDDDDDFTEVDNTK